MCAIVCVWLVYSPPWTVISHLCLFYNEIFYYSWLLGVLLTLDIIIFTSECVGMWTSVQMFTEARAVEYPWLGVTCQYELPNGEAGNCIWILYKNPLLISVSYLCSLSTLNASPLSHLIDRYFLQVYSLYFHSHGMVLFPNMKDFKNSKQKFINFLIMDFYYFHVLSPEIFSFIFSSKSLITLVFSSNQ